MGEGGKFGIGVGEKYQIPNFILTYYLYSLVKNGCFDQNRPVNLFLKVSFSVRKYKSNLEALVLTMINASLTVTEKKKLFENFVKC